MPLLVPSIEDHSQRHLLFVFCVNIRRATVLGFAQKGASQPQQVEGTGASYRRGQFPENPSSSKMGNGAKYCCRFEYISTTLIDILDSSQIDFRGVSRATNQLHI
jgi:hypothetical protein